MTSSMILSSFSSGAPSDNWGCVSACTRPFNRPIMSRPPPAAKGANSAKASASSSDKPVLLAVLMAAIASLSVGGFPWENHRGFSTGDAFFLKCMCVQLAQRIVTCFFSRSARALSVLEREAMMCLLAACRKDRKVS
jgi:hypothetical protein